jgi:hypothetical protein
MQQAADPLQALQCPRAQRVTTLGFTDCQEHVPIAIVTAENRDVNLVTGASSGIVDGLRGDASWNSPERLPPSDIVGATWALQISP